jgi:hypothetical protein
MGRNDAVVLVGITGLNVEEVEGVGEGKCEAGSETD